MHNGGLELEHRAGGFTLRNRTRYTEYDKFYQNVYPGSVNAAGTAVAIAARSFSGASQWRQLLAVTGRSLRSLARGWTSDFKGRNIRVNVVSPGGTETHLMRSALDERPGLEEMLSQIVPLGRLANPDEVARAVLFLASEESSFVAGSELFVDGGVAAV